MKGLQRTAIADKPQAFLVPDACYVNRRVVLSRMEPDFPIKYEIEIYGK